VLIVEDHEVNRLVLSRMVERAGHRALVAGDGQAALDVLGREPVDLVLMDCEMPGMGGLEATRELRRREAQAGAGRVPVLALSGHAGDAHRAASLEAGMDEHLVKPLGAEGLGEVLERWLSADAEQAARALDAERLGELVSDFDAETARAIMTTFLDTTPELVEALGAAARAGDGAAAAAAAHKLRGGCLAIGAAMLADAAASVERAGRQDAAQPVLAAGAVDVEEAWSATRVALRDQMP
jgi:CheY-like chemotaxis protein